MRHKTPLNAKVISSEIAAIGQGTSGSEQTSSIRRHGSGPPATPQNGLCNSTAAWDVSSLGHSPRCHKIRAAKTKKSNRRLKGLNGRIPPSNGIPGYFLIASAAALPR
jgi:hypothetical protein